MGVLPEAQCQVLKLNSGSAGGIKIGLGMGRCFRLESWTNQRKPGMQPLSAEWFGRDERATMFLNNNWLPTTAGWSLIYDIPKIPSES